MNEKLKSERKALLGINSKASPYLVGENEFLDLKNVDFQTPGALTQRWGSTQYIGQTFAGPINSLYEFERLNGASYIVTSHSGGIWYGATTGNYQGMSLTNVGSTISTTGYYYCVEYIASNVNSTQYTLAYLGNLSQRFYGSSQTFNYNPAVQSSNNMDYVVFENYLFMADGTKFLKFDGATTTFVGLPPPHAIGVPGCGYDVFANGTGATKLGFPVGGTIGSYGCFVSYLNNRGFESQIWPITYINATQQGGTILGGNASYLNGGQVFSTQVIHTPQAYGITAINYYSYFQPTAYNTFNGGVTQWTQNYVLMGSYPTGGAETILISYGTTGGNYPNIVNNIGALPDAAVNADYPLGFGITAFGPAISQVNIMSFFPRFLEVYKNRMFCAGFSSMLSTVYYSDLGEPEGYPLDNNFEVRTNDGDIITCLKAYSTRLYIFKKNSFQALYGDNPTNFYLQEISQNYGCLNNSSAVIFNDLLLFLDRAGIMQYNGSALSCISDKINPIFDRMNFTAALSSARMVHDKLRNQVLIGIPVDGATLNNLTISYDYMSGAWTYEDGFTPSVFAAIKGYNNTKNVFYGTPSGVINWFGPSFLSDNGVGFTCSLKSSWFKPLGETTEEQFRRLYTNITPHGVTMNLAVKFYQDYGSSVVSSATILQSEFQNRYEFGIPAKALSVEIFSNQTAVPFQINAISLESRLQRRV